MSCIFPPLCAAGGIAFHIWRKQMLRFFFSGARAAFPSLSLFPLPPQRSLTPPHISFECVCVCLFCTKIAAVLVVWAARSSRSFSFHNNGGHRGSQLEPAAPGCPEVHSSQQRVRHIQERNAAYCWSGKKWPDEPGQQIWAPVDRCFTKGAELWVVSGSFGRHCTVLISAHIQK